MIESLNELADRKPRRTGVRIAMTCLGVAADAILVSALSHRHGRLPSSLASILNIPLLPGYLIVARFAALGMHGSILRVFALTGDAALYSWLACGMPWDTMRTSDLNAPTKTLDM